MINKEAGMRRFDVCNGDADGLCALVQWRLHNPAHATLITGLKRDIELVQYASARKGDEVNVFDLSLRRNRDAVARLLDAGVHVRYIDHHNPGAALAHPLFEAHIDVSDDTCSSLIVDALLNRAHSGWAIVGAHGDNLSEQADRLASEIGLNASQCACLRDLGEAINHNAYGESAEDAFLAPAVLYTLLVRHANPLQAWKAEETLRALVLRCRNDKELAFACAPCCRGAEADAYRLPSTAWARRTCGTLANHLAKMEPDRAHAVFTPRSDGTYTVSVRAPLVRPDGAHEICMRFGGAGRARAAGVDALPAEQIDAFIETFLRHAWGKLPASGGPLNATGP